MAFYVETRIGPRGKWRRAWFPARETYDEALIDARMLDEDGLDPDGISTRITEEKAK